MRLATTHDAFPTASLAAARERWLRPAVGFIHPTDVLKDPLLDADEQRAILSSWASDASAVPDQPTLRWMLGTPEPVRLSDVLECLHRLDRREAGQPVRYA